ncbi:MAG: glycosyltransferase family 1 protein [Akkermansiaceae bacterium]|nr:glycosyltransferase family 1 protein [Akkermansiaceae bacterium]NNM30962.1 glycosyltransferase family 1 protein [Akkermansiaceae bacterium]
MTGLVGLHPVGGVAWDYLQYVIGLARLGHDVYYHEDTWSWPYNPVSKEHTDDAGYSVDYLRDFFQRYAPELSGHWHYLHLHETGFGMTRREFDEVVRSCDLFINVSGANLIPEGLPPHCVKVFLDTDPGYNQIVLSERPAWAENVDRWCDSVDAHDRHFTYAENIHGPDCRVPKLHYDWITTRMPIVTDLWADAARTEAPSGSPWTTVMTWSAFKGPLTYRGEEFGSKDREFERFIDLPEQAGVPLEIAVGGLGAPLERLRSRGWRVLDGPSATLTPGQYAAVIERSRGEFSTAKHVYVALRTGWFSCRSACYLAAGRPVVVQDTGFSNVLPCGEGLISIDTPDDAVAALQRVEADYAHHREAARTLAHDCFGSDRVLARFVDDAFASREKSPGDPV